MITRILKGGRGKQKRARCNVAGLEDGGRGHKPRSTGSLSKVEKAKKGIGP